MRLTVYHRRHTMTPEVSVRLIWAFHGCGPQCSCAGQWEKYKKFRLTDYDALFVVTGNINARPGLLNFTMRL